MLPNVEGFWAGVELVSRLPITADEKSYFFEVKIQSSKLFAVIDAWICITVDWSFTPHLRSSC